MVASYDRLYLHSQNNVSSDGFFKENNKNKNGLLIITWGIVLYYYHMFPNQATLVNITFFLLISQNNVSSDGFFKEKTIKTINSQYFVITSD